MSGFNTAFAAARKKLGPGKTFTFKGKSYTTDRADDTKKPKPRPANKPTTAARSGASRSTEGKVAKKGTDLKTAYSQMANTKLAAKNSPATPPVSPTADVIKNRAAENKAKTPLQKMSDWSKSDKGQKFLWGRFAKDGQKTK